MMKNMLSLMLYLQDLHENNVHYDLLVARPQQSRAETIQEVSLEESRVADERVQETHAEEMRVERLEVEEVPSEGDHDDVNKERISGKNQFLSPMLFAPGQKSRGRPKKATGGPPLFNKPTNQSKKRERSETDSEHQEGPPKSKRGRPKGSRNKPKNTGDQTTQRKIRLMKLLTRVKLDLRRLLLLLKSWTIAFNVTSFNYFHRKPLSQLPNWSSLFVSQHRMEMCRVRKANV